MLQPFFAETEKEKYQQLNLCLFSLFFLLLPGGMKNRALILVPGKKYPETGVMFLYDGPPAII